MDRSRAGEELVHACDGRETMRRPAGRNLISLGLGGRLVAGSTDKQATLVRAKCRANGD